MNRIEFGDCRDTAGHTSTANSQRLAYVGSIPGSHRDSDSWFTPSKYIEAARRAMGGITLDPFSSREANRVVKAERFLTAADDATTCVWGGSRIKRDLVWMNPPYSPRLIKLALRRLINEFDSGSVGAAVVLVNNSTDTIWFHELLSAASAICLTRGRIAFENVDGKRISGNTRGQAFFLIGGDISRFSAEFSQFWMVLACSRTADLFAEVQP